jgi:glycerol kinase
VRYVLALDQGTTSSRAIVFDESGEVRGLAQREIAQRYPQPGWVEHDAEQIWDSQLGTARLALERAGVAPDRLAAIGVANQRETTVLWERATGVPVAPAIVWQDRRTAGACAQRLAAGQGPEFTAATGLLLDPYFSGTKIEWLLDHVPGARARAERGELAFGTIDSWLVWKLTGGACHVTDAGNASRTLLCDLRSGAWSPRLCARLRVPMSLLPEIVDSSGLVAHTAADRFGVPVPIAGIAGDQQAALYGQRCLEPGLAKNTYGTGCFLLMNTGARPVVSHSGLLSTIAWRIDGRISYALEGSVFIGGAVVQWLRDALGLVRSSAEIEALAASVPDSGGVLFVPAFTGLGAPYWDAEARGAILGLTRGSSAAHIARAALESIAFQSAELLDAMRADCGLEPAKLRVDGGATSNDLLMQFQADLLGVPVVRAALAETTALGAARLAARGAGFELGTAAHRERERRWQPRLAPEAAAQRLAAWREAVARVRSTRAPPA